MAMNRRKDRARTPGLWIATNALPVTGGHPFYQRLNQVLDTHAFDAFVEAQCAPFYAATVGRPSLLPGTDVVARIVTGPHDANRQDPHLPMRYDTGRPRAVIRFRISQPRTASLPLPSWTPGAKAITDDGLVAEERVLHPALTMVP